MKFVFFGTSEFAAIVLGKLIAVNYIPSAVVCNPDEPVGRKQILTPPPVKRLIANDKQLMANGGQLIEIFQPATESELLAISHKLLAIKPDLGIIAAYGKILPKEILNIPVHGFINIHGSFLPYYRGASPIQAAILNGDKETGVTIMAVDEEIDHGPVLAYSKWLIADSDNCESLSKKLAISGAGLLIKTIPDYISGKIKSVEQDHSKATYTKIIKKEDGKIDWSKRANEIERITRAFYPWPSAWTIWRQEISDKKQVNKILKIIESEVSEENENKIGEVFLLQHPNILENVGVLLGVKCGEKSLIIKKLQLEGGKILTAKEFLNGHKDFIGSVLE